jgi:hypothetical protein
MIDLIVAAGAVLAALAMLLFVVSTVVAVFADR